MRIKEEFVVRVIVDEIVAIPMGTGKDHFSGIISLNEVGRFLFELLAQERTEAFLVTALMEEYDVDAQTAAADVKEFLDILREKGLLAE